MAKQLIKLFGITEEQYADAEKSFNEVFPTESAVLKCFVSEIITNTSNKDEIANQIIKVCEYIHGPDFATVRDVPQFAPLVVITLLSIFSPDCLIDVRGEMQGGENAIIMRASKPELTELLESVLAETHDAVSSVTSALVHIGLVELIESKTQPSPRVGLEAELGGDRSENVRKWGSAPAPPPSRDRLFEGLVREYENLTPAEQSKLRRLVGDESDSLSERDKKTLQVRFAEVDPDHLLRSEFRDNWLTSDSNLSHMRRVGNPCFIIDPPSLEYVRAHHSGGDMMTPGGPHRYEAGIPIYFPDEVTIPTVRLANGRPTVVDLGVRARCAYGGAFFRYHLVPREAAINETPLSAQSAIIPYSYVGTLKVALRNHSEEPYTIAKGTSLFQLIPPMAEADHIFVLVRPGHEMFGVRRAVESLTASLAPASPGLTGSAASGLTGSAAAPKKK